MGDEFEQKGLVPACMAEFSAHWGLVGVSAGDVESQSFDDGEVFGPVVFSVAGKVLVHDDIEHPVQAVFDRPVRAHDLDQFIRSVSLGADEVSRDRIVLAPAGDNLGDGGKLGEAMLTPSASAGTTTAARVSLRP